MMTRSERLEAALVAPTPPQEARCRACGGWLASAPAGVPWIRARCGNKRCRVYGEGQMIRFREQDLPNDS